MTVRALDLRPAEMRAFRAAVTLGDVALVFRLRWLPRLSRWAVHVEDPDEAALTPQLVVQAGAVLYLDGVPGRLQWVGPESYERQDLGSSLRLLWDDAP